MDVEWAHAIAPGAKILVAVAKSVGTTDLVGAVDAAVNARGHRHLHELGRDRVFRRKEFGQAL